MINSYSFDQNGTPETEKDRAFNYDFDNMPTSIVKSAAATISVYDAGGQRVKKVVPGAATLYIGKLYECTNGTCTRYILAGDQRIAKFEDTDTYFYHTDHLGSASILTDSSAHTVQDIFYYPYGEIKTNTGSDIASHKYTGKEWDAETGLYYYGARYYDPKLARFISADPVVPLRVNQHAFSNFNGNMYAQLIDPQNLNRYSYVGNNPIIFNDPLGLDRFSTILGFASAIFNRAGVGSKNIYIKSGGLIASGASIGYALYQCDKGEISQAQAAVTISISVGDGLSFGLGKIGAELSSKLTHVILGTFGIVNTAVGATLDAGANEAYIDQQLIQNREISNIAVPFLDATDPKRESSGSSLGNPGQGNISIAVPYNMPYHEPVSNPGFPGYPSAFAQLRTGGSTSGGYSSGAYQSLSAGGGSSSTAFAMAAAGGYGC